MQDQSADCSFPAAAGGLAALAPATRRGQRLPLMTRLPEPRRSQLDRLLHDSFEVGILLKAIMAFIELLSGVLLWIFGQRAVAFAQAVTLSHVSRHPHDRVAAWLEHIAAGFSIHSEQFYALYFVSHGLVKLILVFGLWREVRWAFPTSIVALSGFVVYQLYRYSQTGTVGLLVLSAFDLLLIALIWREFRSRRDPGAA